jgi:hypothetical protein
MILKRIKVSDAERVISFAKPLARGDAEIQIGKLEGRALQGAVRPFMTSYGTISIFSAGADSGQRPTPMVASILIHGFAAGIISLGIMNTPRIVKPKQNEQYTVRNLDFRIPESLMRRFAGNATDQGSRGSDAGVRAAAERMAEYMQSQLPIVQAKTGSQILLQADLRPHLDASVEIEVPSFVIWKPSKVQTQTIVAPPSEKPRAAEVTPSVSAPNEELELQDIAITATDLPTRNSQSPAGTTSPVVVHELSPVQKSLVTATQISDNPTPAAVISVSDFRLADRRSVLPPVKETLGSNVQVGSTPGEANSPGESKTEDTGEKRTGQGSIDTHAAQEHEAKGGSEDGRPGSSQGNSVSLSRGSHTAIVITLAKDGRFGAVVVSTSLEDRYPEMEGLWSGRLVYTVHLNVGLPHSWILEYSLPRTAEAAAAGSVAHLEAPWPYSIVRPDLAPSSIGADALIVNGFINKDGRFEKLIPIIPPTFPLSDFVLHCLQEWQFRPAAQDGHPTRVEVMLIIPDQAE